MNKELEKAIYEHISKVARSVINTLESNNFEDRETMMDVGMNYDMYKGQIKGRFEAIELIKTAFKLEDEK